MKAKVQEMYTYTEREMSIQKSLKIQSEIVIYKQKASNVKIPKQVNVRQSLQKYHLSLFGVGHLMLGLGPALNCGLHTL